MTGTTFIKANDKEVSINIDKLTPEETTELINGLGNILMSISCRFNNIMKNKEQKNVFN